MKTFLIKLAFVLVGLVLVFDILIIFGCMKTFFLNEVNLVSRVEGYNLVDNIQFVIWGATLTKIFNFVGVLLAIWGYKVSDVYFYRCFFVIVIGFMIFAVLCEILNTNLIISTFEKLHSAIL